MGHMGHMGHGGIGHGGMGQMGYGGMEAAPMTMSGLMAASAFENQTP